jgi:precorrin-6B methylase 1
VKITIKDYATQVGISTTAVYKQVQKGVLNSVEENGQKYVIIEDEETNQGFKHGLKQVGKNKDDCFKLVEKLMKENKRLTKELLKQSESKERMLLSYVQEMKTLLIEAPKKKKKKKKDK